MKAKVKATGDIVDVTYCHTSGDGVKYYEIYKSGYTMMEDELDFDFSYTPDYWERLKHQYAGMFLQAQISYGEQENLNTEEMIEDAIIYATALVEKLKKEEK